MCIDEEQCDDSQKNWLIGEEFNLEAPWQDKTVKSKNKMA